MEKIQNTEKSITSVKKSQKPFDMLVIKSLFYLTTIWCHLYSACL